jgi:nucleoid DNA-binding protein
MARKKAPAKRKAPAKKKAAAKRPAAKAKSKAKAKAAAKPTAKTTAVKAKMSKTAIVSDIAESTELSRAQVTAVLEELEVLIERHIKKRAVGEFTLPGLLKIKSVKRPATKARMGRNPATGEEILIGPKPASIRVRVTPLKKLKEMVG